MTLSALRTASGETGAAPVDFACVPTTSAAGLSRSGDAGNIQSVTPGAGLTPVITGPATGRHAIGAARAFLPQSHEVLNNAPGTNKKVYPKVRLDIRIRRTEKTYKISVRVSK